MEIVSFNSELALANLMFIRIFSNIKIKRVLKNNEAAYVDVNVVLGNRSRVLKNLQNADKKGTYKLPMIVIKRTGYSRNPERLNDLHNEVKYEPLPSMREYNMLTPLPVDISYELTIITKNVSDADQIASNFMIFFNSSVFCSCEHPKYRGIKMNNQILMDDSVSEEHNEEFDGSQDDFILTTFTFTFKTYLFGGTQKISISSITRKCNYASCSLNNEGVCMCTGNCKTCVSGSNCSDTDCDNNKSTLDAENKGPETLYNGFVPTINSIEFGYYAVPKLSGFIEAMNEIDSYDLSDRWMYRDRLNYPRTVIYDDDGHAIKWKIDESW